ncbi:MAG: hypothetical protein BWX73_02554 [Lentisphaerae bacterium ADurb.Bin082]|nr:MAG: hypothetical protein BWX73_02554 [Lentisphaerae bacterium ADurb.Bin082]
MPLKRRAPASRKPALCDALPKLLCHRVPILLESKTSIYPTTSREKNFPSANLRFFA